MAKTMEEVFDEMENALGLSNKEENEGLIEKGIKFDLEDISENEETQEEYFNVEPFLKSFAVVANSNQDKVAKAISKMGEYLQKSIEKNNDLEKKIDSLSEIIEKIGSTAPEKKSVLSKDEAEEIKKSITEKETKLTEEEKQVEGYTQEDDPKAVMSFDEARSTIYDQLKGAIVKETNPVIIKSLQGDLSLLDTVSGSYTAQEVIDNVLGRHSLNVVKL